MATSKKTSQKPDSSSTDICFTIMPFGGWLDHYYKDVYVPAIESAGLKPHRADDLYRPSTIVNDIWAYTQRARIVLADLTGRNPNVFYELGLAHALAKPAILITETIDDVPFDLRALRIIEYDKNAPDWGAILKSKIQTAIEEVLQAPVQAVLPTFLSIKDTGGKPSVTFSEKEILEIKQELDMLRREVRSTSRERMDRHRRPISYDSEQDALEDFREYVSRGLPEEIIVDIMDKRGVPEGWVKSQLEGLSVKARKRLGH